MIYNSLESCVNVRNDPEQRNIERNDPCKIESNDPKFSHVLHAGSYR